MLVKHGRNFASVAELRRFETFMKPETTASVLREVKSGSVSAGTRVWVPDYSVQKFKLGDYIITEGPLQEGGGRVSMWRRYQIELNGRVIGAQISRPSVEDCESMRRAAGIQPALKHRTLPNNTNFLFPARHG